MWFRITFATPHAGRVTDTCTRDAVTGGWQSRDGWIWPAWVPIVSIEAV